MTTPNSAGPARRPATADDTATCRAIHHRAYHDVVVRQFGAWDDAVQDGFFAGDWARGGYDVFLVGDGVVAYAAVDVTADHVLVRELVVDPDHQGRGLGTALIREAQAVAAAAGVPARIGGLHRNRALTLYRRLGFVDAGGDATHTTLVWHPSSGAVT